MVKRLHCLKTATVRVGGLQEWLCEYNDLNKHYGGKKDVLWCFTKASFSVQSQKKEGHCDQSQQTSSFQKDAQK